ncbi:SOS response-associated peptidase [Solitalea sp. MAHUQ-68]|uniref:Abasic site processing protein n=1 Tax=Solitalea agri TaxID=2953739 RepID=A0A9X2JCZ2_9SPHI|nr:SOS response-associated peptidase [Solitalea agri]MCO4293049.1 SOS response-associated peptidase [Solitalea agri]
MCYNYKNDAEAKDMRVRFKRKMKDEDEQNYKPVFKAFGFDHPLMPVITQEEPELIQLYQWGPFNLFSAENKYNTLNAVSEEIFEKASYKKNIHSKRCLIPATGFYDWMHVGKDRYPFHIGIDEPIFCFAGIYNHWKDKEGVEHKAYTMLTTVANEIMAKIHNTKKRMPVILPRELEDNWLKNDLAVEGINSFLLPYENERTLAYSIDKKVIVSDQANTPKVFEKVDYPELALLMN